MKIPINIGIEFEYFLTKNNVVYNASKVLENILGFSIDQNMGSGHLLLHRNDWSELILRTDGMVCEAQAYFHAIQPIDILRNVWEKLNQFKLLNDYSRSFVPYLANGEEGLIWQQKTIFDNPGNVYSSGKMIRNAYSKTCRYPDKKEKENELVSFRTAGIHIHFSIQSYNEELKALEHRVFNTNNYVHTDNLIKIFDDTYKILYNYYENKTTFSAVAKREEQYQKLGDYRLKFNTKTGSPTLEYRQLPAGIDNIEKFIDICRLEMNKYLLSI